MTFDLTQLLFLADSDIVYSQFQMANHIGLRYYRI